MSCADDTERGAVFMHSGRRRTQLQNISPCRRSTTARFANDLRGLRGGVNAPSGVDWDRIRAAAGQRWDPKSAGMRRSGKMNRWRGSGGKEMAAAAKEQTAGTGVRVTGRWTRRRKHSVPFIPRYEPETGPSPSSVSCARARRPRSVGRVGAAGSLALACAPRAGGAGARHA